jgi:PPK2 family polyphosphate:nucleotide phosphotransferase
MTLRDKLGVPVGQRLRLSRHDPQQTPGCHDRDRAAADLEAMLAELRRLQYRLYAENRRAVLVVLQGMDAAGKDGVIRHVFSGLNPQGCRVTSFKVPSSEERDHDFLWRIHKAVPPYGEIGIFNRSHYEDVLVVRVRKLVPKSVWKARYGQIRAFEQYLTENGIVMLKCFLHISRKEQKERLLRRLEDPDRNWKFSESDLEERGLWGDYQRAYEEALAACSTPWAPWYLVPSDRKWYRNWAVARLLLETLREMNIRLPPPRGDAKALLARLRAAG